MIAKCTAALESLIALRYTTPSPKVDEAIASIRDLLDELLGEL